MDHKIINSLIDSDLYKFTMQQVVLHKFPSAVVRYDFKCRNEANLAQYVNQINEQVDHLCTLRFTDPELDYLSSLKFLKDDYIQFLRIFKLNRNYISIKAISDTDIEVVIEGPWLHTIPFEVSVLAIINEVYCHNEGVDATLNMDIAKGNLKSKIETIQHYIDTGSPFIFADFGTRRRFSREWQEYVDTELNSKFPFNFTGTSNVLLAMRLGLKPIGTMAHEFIQAAQALGPRIVDSQVFAFDTWAHEYRGELGIALSDCVGMDAFMRDFDLYFCKLFDGARHDSGCPYKWGDKLIKHYESHGINPKTKTAVFSDGLTPHKATKIAKYFSGKINISFGIGTNFTNDCGITPLQIVIKMTECNGQPVAKISDSAGKEMCLDDEYISHLKKVFEINR